MQVKARFSDTEKRWIRDVDIIMAHAKHEDRVAGYALAALDEARELLAETEPEGSGSYYSTTRGQSVNGTPVADLALAEALRSFVDGGC